MFCYLKTFAVSIKETKMARKTVVPKILFEGRWLKLLQVETSVGTREFVARRNGLFRAAKVLPLILADGVSLSKHVVGYPLQELSEIVRLIRELGVGNWQVQLLATEGRPVTDVDSELDLSENYQIELPGGVAAKGEYIADAAKREMLEEIDDKGQLSIMGFSELTFFAAADSGTHLEFYTTYIALLRGTVSFSKKEGILPKQSIQVPLPEVSEYIHDAWINRKILVEMHLLTCINALRGELFGKWSDLSVAYPGTK
jgi:hypothetical protein